MISTLSSTPNPYLARILSLSRGASVLYVEDEPEIREEMTEILTALFPEVVTVANGRAGLEALRAREFLMVITDINMPEMTGIEMIAEIRRFRPHQCIMVTSAYNDASNLIPLLNLGVGSFLLKPLNWDQLLPTLYKELSVAQAAQQEARYQQRLENEVAFRTQELRDSQQQIVKLGEAKDNMLALISHEMRTPLNAILGFMDLVRPALAQDAEALSYLKFIEEASHRLDRSTQKALEFSQFSTGKRNITMGNVDLWNVFEMAWGHALNTAGLEPAPTWERQGESDFVVWTDSELVLEVFRNLLENSFKYGGPGVHLQVTAQARGVWNEFTVRDNGPGFQETALANLFTPFMSGNLMHHSEGLGLGLALVDVVMMTLGGKVTAGNHGEGGAWVTLSFSLPKGGPSEPHHP